MSIAEIEQESLQVPGAVVALTGASRADWLAERRKGLGGSDIAALLGISKWHTPVSLWMEKSGMFDDVEAEHTSQQEWGLELEEPIRRAFTRKTGVEVARLPQYTMYRSSALPIALATPDGFDMGESATEPEGVFEAKTASTFIAEEWSGDYGETTIPAYYEAQAQWACAVTGLPYTDVAVLIGASEFRTIRVEGDAELHEQLFERANEFWDLVETGQMPDVDGSSITAKALAKRYAQPVPGLVVNGGVEMATLVARWREATAFTKAAKEAEEQLENQIKAALGEAEGATDAAGNLLVTWRAQQRRGVSLQALYEVAPEIVPLVETVSEFRVLRPKAPLKRGR